MSTLTDDAQTIGAALRFFKAGDDLIEITFNRKQNDRTYFEGSHETTIDGATIKAAKYAPSSLATYFVVNPIEKTAFDRYYKKGRRVRDDHIARRRWLLFDLDPVRPSGVCSTDAEKRNARKAADDVKRFLFAEGIAADPVEVDSGNGYHLYYPIDWPNDAETAATLKRLYKRLDAEIGGDDVNVDRTVYSTAQIMRLPGTVNKKGADTIARPWRPVTFVSDPVRAEAIPYADVLTIAGPPDQSTESDRNGSTGDVLDVEAYLADIGVEVLGQRRRDPLDLYDIVCPFDPSHGGKNRTDTVFTYGDNGAPGFDCKHHSCADHDVSALFAEFGPPKRQHYTGPTAADEFDAISDAVTPENAGGMLDPEKPKAPVFRLITAAELAVSDVRETYIAGDLIVEGQPLIMGGPKKSAKTSIALDMAVGLATGSGSILRRFPVRRQCRVLFMSAESGNATIKATAQTIAETTYGGDLAGLGDNLIFCDQVPILLSPVHQVEIAKIIDARGIDVVFIDPAYMAMIGGEMGDVFKQGAILRDFSDVCASRNVTPIYLHHARKPAKGAEFAAIGLGDLAGAGFAEFARQWILVNHRAAYNVDAGAFQLWFDWGGSAGHGGAARLDIVAGHRPPDESSATPAGGHSEFADHDDRDPTNWRKWRLTWPSGSDDPGVNDFAGASVSAEGAEKLF